MNNLFLAVDGNLKVALMRDNFLVKYAEFGFTPNLAQELLSNFKVQRLDNVFVVMNSIISEVPIQQAVLIDYYQDDERSTFSYCTQGDYNNVISLVSMFNYKKYTILDASPIYRELLKKFKIVFYSYGELIGVVTKDSVTYVSLTELNTLYSDSIKAGETVFANDFISNKVSQIRNFSSLRNLSIMQALPTLSNFLILEKYHPNNKIPESKKFDVSYEYTATDKFVDTETLDDIVNRDDGISDESGGTTKLKQEKQAKRKIRKTIPCAIVIACCALGASLVLDKQIGTRIKELDLLQENEIASKEKLSKVLESRKQYCTNYGNTNYKDLISKSPELKGLVGQYSMSLAELGTISVTYYTDVGIDLDELTESLAEDWTVNEIVDHGEMELKSQNYQKLTLNLNAK